MTKLKALLFASSFALLFVLSSCGGGDAAASDGKGTEKDAAPVAASITVAPEMDSFMKLLTGSSKETDAALTQFEAEGLNRNDMDMYDLKEAKVVAADKDCYTMEAGSGMTVRTYILCWEAGKIKSVEDKGMK